MKQNQIEELESLRYENMESIFNVYQEENGLYYYNLFQNIVFPNDLPLNLFEAYPVTYGDTWPYISYKTLGSPNLWWIIMLANGIMNPLKAPEVGEYLKIPIPTVVNAVINQIR